MKLLTIPRISQEDKCPYLDGLTECHEFFFAEQITKDEMDFLLSTGWRKFGQFLFRPHCAGCTKCISMRVVVNSFTKSKSQRRAYNKNEDIRVVFSSLTYKVEHFELYKLHSEIRFNEKQIKTEEDYVQTFYSCTRTQTMSEFFIDDKLIGFGILDRGHESLSSVYFVFDPDHDKRSLGTFGILKEIEYAKLKKLKYYYLGYWIIENKSMNYKSNFKPFETYNWFSKEWSLNKSEG